MARLLRVIRDTMSSLPLLDALSTQNVAVRREFMSPTLSLRSANDYRVENTRAAMIVRVYLNSGQLKRELPGTRSLTQSSGRRDMERVTGARLYDETLETRTCLASQQQG